MASVARQNGVPIEQLIPPPPFPEELRYLWHYWVRIHNGRSRAGMGPSRATHLDAAAWQFNSGIRLEPWENGLIETLSDCWLLAQSEAASLPPLPKPSPG